MAYSLQQVTSDGTLDYLALSFDYTDRSTIHVYYDGVENTTNWAWAGPTETAITFTPAVPAGVEVMVRRISQLDTVEHIFGYRGDGSGNAAFTADSMDDNFQQTLEIAQEVSDVNDLTADYAASTREDALAAAASAEVASTQSGIAIAQAEIASTKAAEAAASAASIDTTTLLSKAGNLAGLVDLAVSRTNLGLGSIATQNSDSISITGGSVNGVQVGNVTPDTGAFTTLTDSYGNVRDISKSGSAKTTSYTLLATDIGQFIEVGSGGSVTIPDATFSAGDAVSIFNNTSGNITVTCSITTAYIAGTDTDKATVTLATRGVATILFVSGTVCVINGNVT